MARVLVGRETFHRGEFPPVCCKTGERAEVYDAFEFSDTPTWTWILLLFGIFPFLVATAFVTERFSGVLPLSRRAQERLRTARRLAWIIGIAAVLFVLVGLVAGSGWIFLGAGFAAAWLVAITLVWLRSPNANLHGDAVELNNVHAVFVRTITETLPSTHTEIVDDDTDPRGIGTAT